MNVRAHTCIIGLPLALVLMVVSGCGDEPPSTPGELSTGAVDSAGEQPLPAYAEYLADMRICLDPGHGGRAARPDYKRGPTGLREAEVNLRVALFLKDLLEAAGAEVFMTRTADVFLAESDADDLAARADLASRNDCDLLLSIHHNANDRPEANFTTVWYHGQIDHSPASLDIARHVASALIDELRLPEHVGVPVLSDQLIYPRSGFRILRMARVPAVLSEASFHSNPEEEQRLRDPDYNRREARALFIGLARYAYYGVPKARLISPANRRIPQAGSAQVVIDLDDGLRSRKSWGWERRMIFADSVAVWVDSARWPHIFDEETNRLTVSLPTVREPGPLELRVQFQNMFKHSNTEPRINLQVVPALSGI